MFNAQEIQTGRELIEDEVRRINLILKRRADRYIAAADEDWLFPERTASETHWSKIDRDWFLLPNLFELHMGGSIFVGYESGGSDGWDEYGRPREHPEFQRNDRDEGRMHHRARLEWGLRRIGKSIGGSHKIHARTSRGKPKWEGYMKQEVENYIEEVRRKQRRDRPGRSARQQ